MGVNWIPLTTSLGLLGLSSLTTASTAIGINASLKCNYDKTNFNFAFIAIVLTISIIGIILSLTNFGLSFKGKGVDIPNWTVLVILLVISVTASAASKFSYDIASDPNCDYEKNNSTNVEYLKVISAILPFIVAICIGLISFSLYKCNKQPLPAVKFTSGTGQIDIMSKYL